MNEAKTVPYHCAHCGRDFEAEEKEFVECPGCCWSTSVKRRERGGESSEPMPELSKSGGRKSFDFFLLGRLLTRVFAVAAAAGILIVAVSLGIKWVGKPKPSPGASAVTLRGPGAEALPGQAARSASPALGEEDKRILLEVATLPDPLLPTPDQEEILKQRIPLKTGSVEKLPSSPWSEENFKQMIKDQEVFYKVTLPRSYKGKLTDLFKEKYLPAQQAFEAGDLVKARDLWVESLVFPIYGDDLRKHRGVILTMLRAFINDTLSKIGAINQSLVEGNARSLENELGGLYAQLVEHIENRVWPGALNAADQLEKVMAALEQMQSKKSAAPPYPPAIGQVDQDIVTALMDLLNPSPPTVADLAALRQDVEAKRGVIEGLIPEQVQEQKAAYDEALAFIRDRQWDEAERKLSDIRFPPQLAQDAQAKLRILDQLRNAGLDSQKESG